MRKRNETGLAGWGRGATGFALGLVAAFAAPGARAWTASNAFVVVEAATPVSNAGEGFSVPAPGRVRVEPRRDWVLTAPRGGAGFAAPGRPVAWRAVSVLGEDAAGGTVHVCEFRTETTSDHLRAPALAASCPPVGPFAYARPVEGVDVRIAASASQESNGLHRVVTRRLPCPVCGTASGSPPATNLVETSFAAWEWTTPAGTLDGPSCAFTLPGVRKGRHAETLSVRASCPDCSLCTAEKSVSAAFTVSELSVSCPAWLGLDRRAGAPGCAEVVAIALLDPEVEGTVCDWSVSEPCTGEPVPWDGWLLRISASNDGPASRAYLAERVTATALGATASADFTVVSVEVGAGDGAGGTLVPHAADAAGGDLTAAGTNALVAVSVTVEPGDLPGDGRISMESPEGHLYARRGGRLYRLPGHTPLSLGELRRIGLALHGHAVSGKPRDRTLAATHDASGAGDGCAFTVVGLDFSAVSDRVAPYDDISDGSLIDSRTATVTVRTSPEVGGDDLASLLGGISFRSEPVEAEKQEKGLKGLVNERSETDISFTHLSNSVWRASTVRWYGVLPERECAFYSHHYRFSLLLGGVAVTNHEYGVKWPEINAHASWNGPLINETTYESPRLDCSSPVETWFCKLIFCEFEEKENGVVYMETNAGTNSFNWTGQYASQILEEERYHLKQLRGEVPSEEGGLTDCYTIKGIKYFIAQQAKKDPSIFPSTWIVKASTADGAEEKARQVIVKALLEEIQESVRVREANRGFRELKAKEHVNYNAAYRYHCDYERIYGKSPKQIQHSAYKEEKK